jgi:hypothetical protein
LWVLVVSVGRTYKLDVVGYFCLAAIAGVDLSLARRGYGRNKIFPRLEWGLLLLRYVWSEMHILAIQGAVTEMGLVLSFHDRTLIRSPSVPQGYLYCLLDTLT